MPATAERLDDRTFFILYALTKSKKLELSNLRCLYNIEDLDNSQKIFKELTLLQDNFKIAIKFFLAPTNQNIEKAQRIYENIKTYESIIEQLNSDISSIKDIDFTNPVMLYLADAIGCNFLIGNRDYEKFKKRLNGYYSKQKPYKRIYNLADHRTEIIKYFKSADGKKHLPNPKIKLSRITNLIENYQECQTRYNFWHTFKEIENSGLIRVDNLLIDENEPTIDFTVPDIRKFIRKKPKEDKILKSIEQFDIYSDKIVNRENGISANIATKAVRDLLMYALDNPSGKKPTSINEMKRHCANLNTKSFSTIKTAVNTAIQTVLNDKEFKLIGNKIRNEKVCIIHPLDALEQDI